MLKLQPSTPNSACIWVVDKSFGLGSADDNHWVINHPSVSEKHARIIFDGKKYTLRDLGSLNGTYVNDQRVNQRQLCSGDKIRLGDFEFTADDPRRKGVQEQWCLVACSSWLAGQEFALKSRQNQATIKVGRGKDCDIIFPGTHLSREHIEMEIHSDHVSFRDLNPANSTFINETQVQSGQLYPGDKLRLDVYSFQIFGPAQAKTLLPAKPKPADGKAPEALIEAKDNAPESVKQWKTRPTSPGNRDDAAVQPKQQNNTGLKFVAIATLVIFLALGAYLCLY